MPVGGSPERKKVEDERESCVEEVEEVEEEVKAEETVAAGALVGGGEDGAARFEDEGVGGKWEEGEETAGGGVWVREGNVSEDKEVSGDYVTLCRVVIRPGPRRMEDGFGFDWRSGLEVGLTRRTPYIHALEIGQTLKPYMAIQDEVV